MHIVSTRLCAVRLYTLRKTSSSDWREDAFVDDPYGHKSAPRHPEYYMNGW